MEKLAANLLLFLATFFISMGVASADEIAKSPELTQQAEVLDPNKIGISGIAAMGYYAAKAHPELMEKLFRYCGCDYTENHSSLLDCFTSGHGMECDICRDEALLANKLHAEGLSLKEIQRTVDKQFLPRLLALEFKKESEAYIKYKANRLYIAVESSSQESLPSGSAPVQINDKNQTPALPILKLKKKAGTCCSGHKQADTNRKEDGNTGN